MSTIVNVGSVFRHDNGGWVPSPEMTGPPEVWQDVITDYRVVSVTRAGRVRLQARSIQHVIAGNVVWEAQLRGQSTFLSAVDDDAGVWVDLEDGDVAELVAAVPA